MNETANEKKKPVFTTYRIVFIALMAALVYVLTMLRFPLLGSKVHFANAMCLLSGLLLGPLGGGLAAGIGSGLYDMIAGGYGIDEVLVTTVSKFLMAFICALIAGKAVKTADASDGRALKGAYRAGRITAACVIGALSYVLLYMLKTYIYRRFVFGYALDAVWATMLSKLPASLINAVFAFVVTPPIYAALRAALDRAGLLKKLQ